MKKLVLFLSIISLSAMTVQAQRYTKPLQSDNTVHALGLDTASNAVSVSQVLQITGWQDMVTIQSGVTKLTGTIGATASVKLYGSVDGVKYDYATTASDTLAVGDVSGVQVKTWYIAPSKFQYYKAIYKPAGTQTSTITSTALVGKN